MSYTDEERLAITEYAWRPGPDVALRDAAVAAHREMIIRTRHDGEELPYTDICFRFMSEIDHPVPDLGLRATLRQKVIEDTSSKR